MKTKVIVIVGRPGRAVESLLNKMQENAAMMRKKYKIFSDTSVEINNLLSSKEYLNIDVLLLTPQLSFMRDLLLQKSKSLGIAVGLLSLEDYSLSKGEGAILTAEKLMEINN
ncbi:hypothetical protein ACWOAN_08375 [Lactococcus taiwanensis]|uniref:hypothetical protein n=1 Tax=Lactococcus taiwanensis TaxID=1151742 RepID=UPI001907A8CD|nr:hypothetical protein [Lactococcus taiwanensis]